MSIKTIFTKILTWRLLTFLVIIPGIFLLDARPGFTTMTDRFGIGDLFSVWANFDGTRYLSIAQYGYGAFGRLDSYAFFPVYPWLISHLNIFGSLFVSAFVISHLSLILALYYLYKLARLDLSPKSSRFVILLVLLFPVSFFLGSIYPESLLLLLSVLAVFFSRKNNFLFAGIFACIASATSVAGILLWPIVIIEYYTAHKGDLRKMVEPSLVWLTLPPLGLIAFMRLLADKTGDPFFFITSQTDKIILIYQVFFRYARMVVFMDHMDPLFFTILLEMATGITLLLITIFTFNKMRFSYWFYVFISFLIASLSGTFVGLPRFTLAMFPVFIFMATWLEQQHPFIRYFYYGLCLFGSVFSIVLFTRGYFVS